MVLTPLNSINREVLVKDNAFVYFETGQHFAVLLPVAAYFETRQHFAVLLPVAALFFVLLRQHRHRSCCPLLHNTYRDVAAETQAVT